MDLDESRQSRLFGGGARIQEGVVSLGGYADFLAQHARERCGAADQLHHGPVCGRRCLQSGDHRFQHHGQRHVVHVHYRTRRDQDRYARGSYEKKSWVVRLLITASRASRISPLIHEHALRIVRELFSLFLRTMLKTHRARKLAILEIELSRS